MDKKFILQTDTKKLYLGKMNPTPSLSYPVCLKDQFWACCSSLSIIIDDVIRVPLSVGSKLVLYADNMQLYRKIDRPEDYTM